jgi:probable HAF family extracellular repeat protein
MRAAPSLVRRRRVLRWLLGGAGGLALSGCGGGEQETPLVTDTAGANALSDFSRPSELTRLEGIRYRVVDLSAFLPRDQSQASAINEKGWVIGGTHETRRPFIYRNGTMELFESLGSGGAGVDINDHGQATGLWQGTAFLYSDGVLRNIGTLGGPLSMGRGINAIGDVVGWALVPPEGPHHAFLYKNGVMEDLLGGPKESMSSAEDINDAGQVTGTIRLSLNHPNQAFLYESGTVRYLGGEHLWTSAMAINAGGWVTGQTGSLAFLYDGQQMHSLGALKGRSSSAGWGINSQGWVVGSSTGPPFGLANLHAFVHDGIHMTDLNDLLEAGVAEWVIHEAYDINSAGQIVAVASRDEGFVLAVLLNPVPC